MTSSRLLRLGAAFAILASFACGGDDGGGGDSVSAGEYASSICTGVDEWFQAIQAQTEQLTDAAADLEGDLDGAKESIEGYIDDVIVATDALLEEVDAAGEPDVENGAEVAAALEEGFENVKGEFEQAKEDIGAVSTDDPEEFTAEFERIGGRLQDGSAMEEAFAGLEEFSDNEELDAAFDEEESCQALSGS
jgi:hypothetical protein